MVNLKALTGNAAAAYAAMLAQVGAGVFFPIGPSDVVMEVLRELIDSGEAKNCEILQMENEKAVLSAKIGLSRLGVRTIFATCGEGLTWPASEMKYASGSRLPLLIVSPSRALGPPTTVRCDHGDFIMQRDMGWLQFYCEDAQDILDTVIQTYRVAEDEKVMLPALIGYDGWEVSHSTYRVNLPLIEEVDSFLPGPRLWHEDYFGTDWFKVFQKRRMHKNPRLLYMEKKFELSLAMENAKNIIEEVGKSYNNKFGRNNHGLIETLYCQDADVIIITMGGMTSTARFVVEALRKDGYKVGLVKLRTFRPFPKEKLIEALSGAKVVVSVERNSYAAVYSELRSAFYDRENRPVILGRILGIGGREISYYDFLDMLEEALEVQKHGFKYSLSWKGVREGAERFASIMGE